MAEQHNNSIREYTLFFSWQNDKRGVKKIIRNALNKAKAELQKEDIKLLLDEDTRGRVGNRDIVQAVLDKIEKCDIFLADVTPVITMYKDAKGHLPKHLPNSNVMFEYGYALHCRGEERMITLAKLGRGEHVEFMPFDINHNTLTTFRDESDLKNIALWIKNIITEVVKERENLVPDYDCEVSLLAELLLEPILHPQYKKTVYVAKMPESVAELSKRVEKIVKPVRKMQEFAIGFSTQQRQWGRLSSLKTNKSYSHIMLSFWNKGTKALENCNLTIEAEDKRLLFATTNVERGNSFVTNVISSLHTHVYDDHVSFHIETLNPHDSSLLDSFYIYVPHSITSTKLLWKLSSKTFRTEGEIGIEVKPEYMVHYVENVEKAGTEVIEDYVVAE